MNVVLLCLIYLIHWFCSSQSANFSLLPLDIVNKILSWNPDRSASRIHTKTNKDYQEELEMVQQLQSMVYAIEGINDSVPCPVISNLTEKLELSKTYILKRTRMTQYVANIYYSNPEKFRRAMHAFQYKSITISQYQSLSFDELSSLSQDAKEKLKIFIGRSRALVPMISADLPPDEKPTKIVSMGRHQVYLHFPWIRLRYCLREYPNCHSNGLYLGYLMEFIWSNFHKEMNIPSQESIWYISKDGDDYKQLQFLKLLMDRYHLRIDQKNAFWHRWMLGSVTGIYSFMWILDETDRLNHIFLPSNISFKYQFMTEFIIDVVERHKIPRQTRKNVTYVYFPGNMADANIDQILALMWHHYLSEKWTDFNKLANILVDVYRYDLNAHNASIIRNQNKEYSLEFWAKLWRIVHCWY